MSQLKNDVVDFDVSAFEAADTAEMTVEHPVTGELTSWKITVAGPGHPVSVKLADSLAREALRATRDRETALGNGRKYKAPERTPEESRLRNAAFIAERILGWTPVRINGADLPFNHDNAVKLLVDPRYIGLYNQILNFISDEKTFQKV